MISLKDISMVYKDGEQKTTALSHVSLEFPSEGLYFITGKSGSGKSTLLGILGGLLTPSEGSYIFDKKEVQGFTRKEQTLFFREKVSFVFQDFNLLNDFTVNENISLSGADKEETEELVKLVDLQKLGEKKACGLSGGEKQRTAIARALGKKTDVLLLDEPTGNLDSKNSIKVFETLKKISSGLLVIVVTHDLQSALKYGDYIITLENGQVKDEKALSQSDSISLSDACSSLDAYRIAYGFSSYAKVKTCDTQGNKKEYSLDSNESRKELFSFLSVNLGQNASLTLEDKEDKIPSALLKSESEPDFNRKKQWKYAFSMLKKKPFRILSFMIILVLSLTLLSLQMTLTYFDASKAMSDAFIQEGSDFSMMQKTELNENLNQKGTYMTGECFYNELSDKFDDVFPVINAQMEKGNTATDCYVVPIKKEITFSDGSTYFPSYDGAVISEFLDDVNGHQDTITLSFRSLNLSSEETFKTEDVFKSKNYTSDLEKHIADNNYQYEQKDLFLKNYSLIFVSYQRIKDIIASNKTMKLYGADPIAAFFVSTKTYTETLSEYSLYSNEKLIYGSVPVTKEDVVLSYKYLSQYADEKKTDYHSLLGQELSFIDLASSPNHVSYQTLINLFGITEKVRICGITDNDKADIYVHDDFWSAISSEEMFCFNGFLVSEKTPELLGEKVIASGFNSTYHFAEPVYELQSFVKSSADYVLFSIAGALFLISLLLLVLYSVSLVKDHSKEIATLKSLGIKRKELVLPFLKGTFICIMPSYLLSIGLSYLSVYLINLILKHPDVFNISYSLLTLSPYTLLITLIISIAAGIISCLFSIRKIMNTDVYQTLKSI